jgi:hypothetical protein
MSMLTRERAIEKNKDEPFALSKQRVVRDEILSTQKHDVDAMMLVPALLLIMEKIHYSVEDAEDFVQSYLGAWAQFN